MITKIINSFLFKNKILDVPEVKIDSRDWELKKEMLSSSEGINAKQFSRRDKTPAVKNQGSIGSCVGHSGRVVYGDTLDFKGKEPSAMWIYKKAKLYDYFPGEDYSGTTIMGACKALKTEGCCEEKFWPYKSSENAPMLDGAEDNAKKYKIDSYYVIKKENHDLIKQALLNESLWTSFRVKKEFYYTPKTGIVNSEKYLNSQNVGGHAVAMTGWKYIDGDLYWEFQNSWGSWFGDKGFFYMESSLYEKVLMNAVGPNYIKTAIEANNPDYVDENKKQEKEKAFKKRLKRNLKILAGALVVGLLTYLVNK